MKTAILGKQNPRRFREIMKKNIENAGFDADILDMETRSFSDFADKVKAYDAIITCGEKVPADAIGILADGNVRLLSRWGVGTEEIDKREAANRGIAVCNAPNTLSVAVAECALGMMIDLLREFPARDASVRNNDWSWFFDGILSRQLEGKTVGLIGFGSIAKALARMLDCFDCRVIACDRYAWDAEAAARWHVTKAEIGDIVGGADVISLHYSSTPDTYHMVDRAFLAGMKRDAILINTARGALIDEEALVWALKNHVIGAAGLDVFEKEPPAPDNELLRLKNVMLLPHSGAGTSECLEKSSAAASKNVIDFLNGAPVPSILNPSYRDHLRKG